MVFLIALSVKKTYYLCQKKKENVSFTKIGLCSQKNTADFFDILVLSDSGVSKKPIVCQNLIFLQKNMLTSTKIELFSRKNTAVFLDNQPKKDFFKSQV